MSDIPLSVLFAVLIVLIVLSAFFSGSETGLMAINRYRLRHLVKIKHPGAMRAQALLERTDRLIGLILLGNNFVNILASSIATVIALRLMGDAGIAIAASLMTLIILIFGEVTPKTLAALNPERVAFPASYVLGPLLKLLYPLVWLVSTIVNYFFKVLRISTDDSQRHHLSAEELRTVVNEAGALIPRRHQAMLLSILDLEKVTVDDIMVPRNEIAAINLEDDTGEIILQLSHSRHTRMPVCRDGIDNIIGILHLRDALPLIAHENFNKETLLKVVNRPYFVPEGTPLNTQLLNFQRAKERIGLVVDEYGDIRGLATLEDILEEIVGEFTTDPATTIKDIYPQEDGSFVVDGSANVRELNKVMHWDLPTDGPKTLNGLIIEYLEAIPEPGTSLQLAGHPVEILQTTANAVKRAKISLAHREDPLPSHKYP